MSISKDNVRANLIINRELKKQLEKIAKEQNRSFNNLIITMLKNSVKISLHDDFIEYARTLDKISKKYNIEMAELVSRSLELIKKEYPG